MLDLLKSDVHNRTVFNSPYCFQTLRVPIARPFSSASELAAARAEWARLGTETASEAVLPRTLSLLSADFDLMLKSFKSLVLKFNVSF